MARFTPFAIVLGDGMSVVDKLYSGYGEGAPGGNGTYAVQKENIVRLRLYKLVGYFLHLSLRVIFSGPNQGRIQSEGNKVG